MPQSDTATVDSKTKNKTAMNKTRNNYLIKLANEALLELRAENNANLFTNTNSFDIKDSYNGQIAALSVSIAMTGLLPTLAIYYQDTKTTVNRRNILDVIARIIQKDENREFSNASDDNFTDAKALFSFALSSDDERLKKLTKEIEDCAVALKQVVRTYNLVKS